MNTTIEKFVEDFREKYPEIYQRIHLPIMNSVESFLRESATTLVREARQEGMNEAVAKCIDITRMVDRYCKNGKLRPMEKSGFGIATSAIRQEMGKEFKLPEFSSIEARTEPTSCSQNQESRPLHGAGSGCPIEMCSACSEIDNN